ncbi:MAG: hypothetical protein HYT62_04390 [Candidatus Yanofskybacteria bacterium]|nr:hypothetical protein [Candidatus Yanofskybacteria bacterium]
MEKRGIIGLVLVITLAISAACSNRTINDVDAAVALEFRGDELLKEPYRTYRNDLPSGQQIYVICERGEIVVVSATVSGLTGSTIDLDLTRIAPGRAVCGEKFGQLNNELRSAREQRDRLLAEIQLGGEDQTLLGRAKETASQIQKEIEEQNRQR